MTTNNSQTYSDLYDASGSGLLVGWVAKARARRPWNLSRRYVEAAAVYWHMVDLLWVVIFTLVYLVHVPLVRP